jgi:RimJ/RimL family protein N-acetyltransferase
VSTSEHRTFDVAGIGPATSGALVEVRPVRRDDLRFLYDMAVSDELSYRWRYRGTLPTFEIFADTFMDGCLNQAVAIDRATGEPIGHLSMYNADLRNMIAFLSAVIAPARVGDGSGAEASLLFVSHTLARWPLRKIYMEVPEFTYDGLRTYMNYALGVYLTEEGRLREYTYFDGRFWDMIILAADRDQWAGLAAAHRHRIEQVNAG